MTYEEYKKSVQKNTNSTMFARDSYSSKIINNESLIEKSKYQAYKSPYAFNPDLDTSQGLYKLAHQSGLGQDADRVIRRAGGDEQEFFSGGIVSDVMDVLNMASYGIVGLVKGKGFVEGIKNRESFSDEDSLGKYGWTGKVAGFALDIVLDPFTYISPFKQIAKIPGIMKGLDSAKKYAFGEFVPIIAQRSGAQDAVSFSHRIGGWSPLKILPEKMMWGFAMEKKFLEGIEDVTHMNNAAKLEMDKLSGTFASLEDDAVKKILRRNEDGTIGRVPIQELMRLPASDMPPESLDVIKRLYSQIDKNADELVELGAISKEARDLHANEYLTQVYEEFLTAKKQVPGTKPLVSQGSNLKGRLRMSEEDRLKMNEELGQVVDPRLLAGMTLMKQSEMLANARLQKHIADNFGLTPEDLLKSGDDTSLWHRVSEDRRYGVGKEVEIKKELNTTIKSLRSVFKQKTGAIVEHKGLLQELDSIEKKLNSLKNITEKEYGEAVSGLQRILREGGISRGATKKVPTTEGQNILADTIKRFLKKGNKVDDLLQDTVNSKDLFKKFITTREGYALQRAFDNPKIMYQWNSPEEFFDAVRYPDQAKVFSEAKDELVDITDKISDTKVQKTVDAQKEIGKLTQTKEVLSSTNLKLVEDAMIKLEEDYADLLFKKSNLVDMLNSKQYGSLAGKYIPKEVWNVVKGTFDPKKEVGQAAVMVFKHAKVIWNPGSFGRNAMGAAVANWWKLGLGPWRADVYMNARKELKTGGKIFQRMEKQGFTPGLGQVQELMTNFMDSRDIRKAVESQLGIKTNKARAAFKRADKKLTELYSGIDDVAKVAAFTHAVKKGMSDSDAMKAAYSATFNYSQVTPFVQSMRKAIWGVPFITFSLKAVPLVASTIINNPNRISVFGKARNTLFEAAGVEGEQESDSMPAWMRDDSFMLRLPWKDSEDRPMYFDLTYILPFGSIMSGEYLKNPLETNPVLQTVKELSQNRTFSGHKIFNESDDLDTVLADIFIHTSKLAMPPLAIDQLPQGYQDDGERVYGNIGKKVMGVEPGPNERTMYQEAFRLIGASVQPFDIGSRERAFEYNRKKELTQLLHQNGVLDQFNISYIPKENKNKPLVPIGDGTAKPIGR